MVYHSLFLIRDIEKVKALKKKNNFTSLLSKIEPIYILDGGSIFDKHNSKKKRLNRSFYITYYFIILKVVLKMRSLNFQSMFVLWYR